MSKTIPALLLTHKAQQVTTLCRLLKIVCKDGTTFGFANLDIDVSYNDQAGPNSPSLITYRSSQGFTPQRLAMAAGTSVDNSDLVGIIADLESLGVTEEQIRSGLLDYADAYCYEVNYNDLTPGRHETKGRGKCGRVSMGDESFNAEFRSLTQLYKQSIGKVTSLTCRNQFGDARCQHAVTWIAATITAVSGTEPTRIFTAASLGQAASYFVPGLVRVLTGQNAGKEIEVETFAAGVVSMSLDLYFNLLVGDQIEISQNCNKVWDDAAHGCLYHYPATRALFFDGEPHIPVGQEGALSTPGAEID